MFNQGPVAAEEVASVRGKMLLVVHEDSTLVEQIKNMFAQSGSGVFVKSASSGPDALGVLSAETPDAILVDAELSGPGGYALTQQLKASPQTRDVPVVIMTLEPSEASALKARQAGASAQFPASGPLDAVVSKITALIGGQVSAPTAPVSVSADPGEPALPSPAPVAPEAAPVTELAPQPTPSERPDPAPAAAPAQSAPLSGYSKPAQDSSVHAVPSKFGDMSVCGDSARLPDLAPNEIPHIDDLLRLLLQRGGSDLHITSGSPPGLRQRGDIIPVENVRPLTPRDTMEMIFSLLSEEQRRRFETELELDFAYSIPGLSRFRANVFQQRNSIGAAFRVIPIEIPTLEDLHLPAVCRTLADRPRGLVLVTGPTGSGKSTTLAAMIDHINETRPVHIITLEDPIEFMHRNKKAYVNQREVGEDTHSFASALKRILRQDPDVILVGEMRDLETISAAITAAETGHLVLATLHTTGGPETVDRVIDVFPPHQQQQVRMQLSTTLEGVLSQTLLRSTDGRSRVMAMEIMLGIPAISNLIREGKTHQMETIIQGGAQLGMQTLDQSLKGLLTAGKVTFEEAISKAKKPRELAQMMGRKL